MFRVFKPISLAGLFLITALPSSFTLAEKLQIEDREPEAATGLSQKLSVSGENYMLATANPYASEAGFNILQKSY